VLVSRQTLGFAVAGTCLLNSYEPGVLALYMGLIFLLTRPFPCQTELVAWMEGDSEVQTLVEEVQQHGTPSQRNQAVLV
jgi:hypothetical protein